MPDPFRLDGHTYRTRGVAPHDAMLICGMLRDVAPHLPVMVPADRTLGAGVAYLEALTAAIAKLPAVPHAWIGSECLASIDRRVGLRWRPIWDKPARKLLFRDISEALFGMLILHVLHGLANDYLTESVPA